MDTETLPTTQTAPPAVPAPTSLAKLLKLARVAAGLTQVELGQKIGTGQSTISAWESGKAKPNTTYILALARATGADRDQFLDAIDRDQQ